MSHELGHTMSANVEGKDEPAAEEGLRQKSWERIPEPWDCFCDAGGEEVLEGGEGARGAAG